MNRREEGRRLLRMSTEEMVAKAEGKLVIVDDLDALHQHFAESIAKEIMKNNKAGRPTKLILPVGPTGQYPILKDMINKQGISLKNCFFFFMDEYCDDNGYAIPEDHPLSFKGEMKHLFFNHIKPKLNIPPKQLVFPNHLNLHTLKQRIADAGGIDTCYGGIGIHGHVAFNEPEPNVKDAEPRLVYLNDFTITINAIRAEVGGNLVNFPRKAVTLGMKQILGAKRIRLYCRSQNYDWANTILRLALFGEPGDDYPVTYIRNKDYMIVTDKFTASKPKFIL